MAAASYIVDTCERMSTPSGHWSLPGVRDASRAGGARCTGRGFMQNGVGNRTRCYLRSEVTYTEKASITHGRMGACIFSLRGMGSTKLPTQLQPAPWCLLRIIPIAGELLLRLLCPPLASRMKFHAQAPNCLQPVDRHRSAEIVGSAHRVQPSVSRRAPSQTATGCWGSNGSQMPRASIEEAS